MTGPVSVMVRASASRAGGRWFDPGSRNTKDFKIVPVAALLGAQHHKTNTLISSPNI